MKIGIYVGRFQTPELHNGYKYMLSRLQLEWDYYAIIIGSSIEPNERNPLDYDTRKSMVEQYVFKKPVFVSEIVDFNDSKKWNEYLDKLIETKLESLQLSAINIDANSVYLIGSRDSFISGYKGIYQTIQIEPFGNYNSTELRNQIVFLPNWNFVSGMICSLVDYLLKKNIWFGIKLNRLKPTTPQYNSDWSKGYIYCIKYLFSKK